jgi:hypothetical protein
VAEVSLISEAQVVQITLTGHTPEQTIRRYRVNLRHKTITDGERAAREAIAKVVARSLKRMKDEE